MAEPTPATVSEGSKLCDACSVIRFNDAELLGKYFREEQDGSSFLALPTQWTSNDTPKLRLDYRLVDTFPELPFLKGGAESGCVLCRILQEEIRQSSSGSTCTVVITLYYIWGDRFAFSGMGLAALVADLEWFGSLPLSQSGPGDHPHSVVFAVESDHEIVKSWLRIPESRKQQVLCQENIAFMKDSISFCEVQCGHARVESMIPTRLVDVAFGSKVRLVEKRDCGETFNHQPPKFAALSYCWGDKGNQLQTTTATIASHKDGIDDEMFPQAIRDAIQVCRLLDIRYLWVDALCIIQDDAADWQQESSSMGLIYNNALVTLVAASSSSCDETFIHRQYSKVTLPFVSRLNQSVVGQYGLFPSGYGAQETTGGWPFLDESKSAWQRRGWTLQEDIMSTRKLIFGVSMIHFQCSSSNLQENNFAGFKARLKGPDILERNKSLQDLLNIKSSASFSTLYTFWEELLSTYSRRALTRESDRLPAISGIAKVCSDILGDDTYLAGFWKGDIPYCLMWYLFPQLNDEYLIDLDQLAQELRQKPNHPSSYIAPSWSSVRLRNMAVESGCIWGAHSPRNQVRARCSIDGHTTVCGNNPYGEIDHGPRAAADPQ
ncbi:heterokaryon incompatibility protein [Colletotrichum plurivorum]|uniref:Heterokaryon incompatibility protein n=1 Tax=Colletotrichum plurivorum TaxID=2175906 RepID=A0A8H6N170_9PEZI|nr:heterokaryon incompatibility protein [Colletotrichum plurivorum]